MEAGSVVAAKGLILCSISEGDIGLWDKTCTPVIFFS